MIETRLHPTGQAGCYAAEFGGISTMVDMNTRVATVFVSLDEATDADFDQSEDCLSRLGIVNCDRMYEIQNGLVVLEADF
jgi:hypothetical protein